MTEKIAFREKLKGILELAQAQEHQIGIEEVKKYFAEENLSEEQMELVFDYLLSQKVVIKGYISAGKFATGGEQAQEQSGQEEAQVQKLMLNAEEQAYLKEYEKDLQALKGEQEGERAVLFGQAAAGDALAKSRLVELYLKEVVKIAKEMRLHQEEIFLGDLVQEGNVGVLLGIDKIQDTVQAHETAYETTHEIAYETAHETIVGEIRQGMERMIEEQTILKQRDKQMVEKVNQLDESIKTLTEDLGRKVTIEELSVYMGMEQEEIEDILRLAGEETEEEEA